MRLILRETSGASEYTTEEAVVYIKLYYINLDSIEMSLVFLTVTKKAIISFQKHTFQLGVLEHTAYTN